MTRTRSTRPTLLLWIGLTAAPLHAAPATEERLVAGPPVGHSMSQEVFDAADFNGDGALDLLREHDMVQVIWDEARPGRSFAPHVVTTTPNELFAGRAGDLDGDGDADVAAGTDGGFRWYENLNGAGDFGGSNLITNTIGGLRSAALADLDGDGDLDAALAVETGTLWYRNDGSGSFSGALTIGAADDATQVVTGDADDDGDQDVLVASSPADEIRFYRNGNGVGTAWTFLAVDSAGADPRRLSFADLDGDDDLDIVAALYDSDPWDPVGRLAVYTNTGVDFGAPQTLEEREAFCTVAVGDFDGDGDDDIAAAWTAGEPLQWHANADGLGSFGAGQPIATYFPSYYLLVADFSGNGSPDIASKTNTMRGIWMHANEGDGSFDQLPTGLASDTHSSNHWARDLDGDGDLDLVGASRGLVSPRQTVWHENLDGRGDFQLGGVLAGATADEYPADLDGDGDLDVLLGHTPAFSGSSGEQTTWVENGGAGSFGAEQLIASIDATRVRAGDLDGDGKLDVLIGSRNQGTQPNDDGVYWFRNSSAGVPSFSGALPVFTAMSGIGALVPADLDNDGDLDVLTAGLFGGTALRIENVDGLGTFAAPTEIVADDVHGLHAPDLDGDGDLDVLVAAEDRIFWFENTDGAGALSAPIDLVVWSTPAFVHNPAYAEPSDLDGDGDTDLLAVYPGDGLRVAWFENTDGAMTLGPEQLLHTDASPIALGSGDLNGDGVADPIASTTSPGGVYFAVAATRWWPSSACESAVEASELVRLGSPPNPQALVPGLSGAPVLGGTWDPVVDHTAFLPTAIADFLLVSTAPANVPSNQGTILCGFGPGSVIVLGDPGVPFQVALPDDCELAGLSLCAQAGSFLPSLLFFLTNALDATVGTP